MHYQILLVKLVRLTMPHFKYTQECELHVYSYKHYNMKLKIGSLRWLKKLCQSIQQIKNDSNCTKMRQKKLSITKFFRIFCIWLTRMLGSFASELPHTGNPCTMRPVSLYHFRSWPTNTQFSG
jgi:hypothetical protein